MPGEHPRVINLAPLAGADPQAVKWFYEVPSFFPPQTMPPLAVAVASLEAYMFDNDGRFDFAVRAIEYVALGEPAHMVRSPDGVLPNGNYRLTDLKDRRRREEVSGDRLRLYLTVTDVDCIQPDEFLVDQILKSRGTGRTREYLVKWRGYPVREATW